MEKSVARMRQYGWMNERRPVRRGVDYLPGRFSADNAGLWGRRLAGHFPPLHDIAIISEAICFFPRSSYLASLRNVWRHSTLHRANRHFRGRQIRSFRQLTGELSLSPQLPIPAGTKLVTVPMGKASSCCSGAGDRALCIMR